MTRHLGTGDYHQGAAEILGLTKMDWNNDSLYNFMPVTNHYASVLAAIVKRMGSLSRPPTTSATSCNFSERAQFSSRSAAARVGSRSGSDRLKGDRNHDSLSEAFHKNFSSV